MSDSIDGTAERIVPPRVPTVPVAVVSGAMAGYWAGDTAWALLGGAATGLLIWAGWVMAAGLCWAAARDRGRR